MIVNLIFACTACAGSRSDDAWSVFVTGASALVGFLLLATVVIAAVFKVSQSYLRNKQE